MKKTLLSLFALALAMGVNAQSILPFSGSVGRSQQASGLPQNQRLVAVIAKAAPSKITLNENQHLAGLYTSDNLAEYGLGIPGYGAFANAKAAIYMTSDLMKYYEGKKIVAIRFGLCSAVGSSRVFVSPVSESGVQTDVVSQSVASTTTGWNEVTLTSPYTIATNTSYLIGFDYNQKATKSGQYYTDDCYPLSLVSEGVESNLYIYSNISATYGGSGEGWYNFGSSNGNLSVQFVVEGNFNAYDVTPYDFKKVAASLNQEKTASIEIFNNGNEKVTSVDYIVTVDGIAGTEQHAELSSPVETSSYGTFDATIPGQTTKGTKTVSVEVTKVNGQVNTASDKVADGSVGVFDKIFDRNCVAEEFTTEQCYYCPQGAKVLAGALELVDETRVYTACHHAGFNTDWLTKTWDTKLANVLYGSKGTFAPALMLNRRGDIFPSTEYGIAYDIASSSANIVAAYMKAQLNEAANAALNITATPNEDGTLLNVKVTGECNEGFDQNEALLTLYLTEDSIKAKSQSGASGTFYHMHVIRYANSPWGEAVTWNDNTFEANFSISMNDAWVKKNMKLIAFLNTHNESDYNDNIIENSIGCDYPLDPTAINGITDDAKGNVETARYSLDGVRLSAPQKGLNIVKMANGKTMKVMVK